MQKFGFFLANHGRTTDLGVGAELGVAWVLASAAALKLV
jgi:hypothetical protein